MFFRPKVLPLEASQLSEDSVEALTDRSEVQAKLASVLPQLVWSDDGWARGETIEGNWFEFAIAEGGTLFMRCSLRADTTAEVQRICDSLGWIAVDQEPQLFQPNAKPLAA